MKMTVDARGLSCPQPVVLTKKALEEQGVSEVLTIVDNTVALANVSRLLETLKLAPIVSQKDNDYYIDVVKTESLEEIGPQENLAGNTVIMLTSNLLGNGDPKLGTTLMKSFFYSISQLEGSIKSLIFMNAGVMLTTEGSEVLEHIKIMESRGIEVLSCGTCLDFYGLSDKLCVGLATNMYTITERMTENSKLITL
ncbi:MAG: sulfurtransferase-like selenium metabolism protein YedF [Syntrophomonadaceae bacterium]|nr:sulfurtransferase-like selenium metabolism protein YedF [Syntrophomonadaceae bacterium]